jgi:hypothetical protein
MQKGFKKKKAGFDFSSYFEQKVLTKALTLREKHKRTNKSFTKQ